MQRDTTPQPATKNRHPKHRSGPRPIWPAMFGKSRTLFGVATLLTLTVGCLSEHSFPFSESELTYIEVSPSQEAHRTNTRQWLKYAHQQLRPLVPNSGYEPLLTEDLTTPEGQAVDVFKYFDKSKAYLHTAIGNFSGLMHTSQVTGDTEAIEIPAPDWPGFEDIWIETQPGVSISARLGLAMRDGKPIESDCIVLLPGLLGDNIRARTRDICAGLRDAGFHALALEFRGHGQAEAKYPSITYNFGAMSAPDLLVVAEWLQDKACVRRTGVIGFSWSANVALLSAWEDGRRPDDPMVPPGVAKCQPKIDRNRRHFEAGVIAVSPTLDFETLIDRLETPHSFTENPVLSSIQATIARRVARKNHGPKTGSLQQLINYEYAKSCVDYETGPADGATYVRLAPYKDLPYSPKLESSRIPVLVIHSANDPLAYAQEVANFFADTPNPNVAGVMLHGGGHDGFAAYCSDYLYSLFVNFFDARRGPKAVEYRARAG